jgi:hypothetical protein
MPKFDRQFYFDARQALIDQPEMLLTGANGNCSDADDYCGNVLRRRFDVISLHDITTKMEISTVARTFLQELV